MQRIEELDTADAIDALEVADFPLLLEEDLPEHTVITDRPNHGREGLLPTSLFAPTPYDLDDPFRASQELTEKWTGNIHVAAVLRNHLGYHANRVGTHILMELVYLSAGGHDAETAISAGCMQVDSEVRQETLFALWDDGNPYDSPEAVEGQFSQDGQFNLSKGYISINSALETGINLPAPTLIVSEVTRVFNGELTVLSGESRTHITYEADEVQFEHSSTPGIVGNLVIAHLPHKAQVAQQRSEDNF